MKSIKLEVSDMMISSDIGRGAVKIDSKIMNSLGIDQGDLIEINGTKKTAGIAMRTYPSAIGMNWACMDRLIRENAGLSVGDMGSFKRLKSKKAKLVVLAPSKEGFIIRLSPFDVKQSLYLRPVINGDMVRISHRNHFAGITDSLERLYPVGAELDMKIVKTKPNSIVTITEDTIVHVLTEPVKEKPKPAVKTIDIPTEIVFKVAGNDIRYKRISKKGFDYLDARKFMDQKDVFVYKEKDGKYYAFKKVKVKSYSKSKATKKEKEVIKTADDKKLK